MRLPRSLEPGRWRFVARQSARPTGLLGRIVAWVMSRETQPENRKAVDLGTGTALARVMEAAPCGEVAGTERSPVMLRSARRRLRRTNRPSRSGEHPPDHPVPNADLRLVPDGLTLPFWSDSFDRVFSVNTVYFWENPQEQLREMARVLKPHGRLLLGFAWDDRIPSRYSSDVYRFRHPRELERLVASVGLTPADLVSDSLSGKDFHWLTAHHTTPAPDPEPPRRATNSERLSTRKGG